jgi:hypothetical protein
VARASGPELAAGSNQAVNLLGGIHKNEEVPVVCGTGKDWRCSERKNSEKNEGHVGKVLSEEKCASRTGKTRALV